MHRNAVFNKAFFEGFAGGSPAAHGAEQRLVRRLERLFGGGGLNPSAADPFRIVTLGRKQKRPRAAIRRLAHVKVDEESFAWIGLEVTVVRSAQTFHGRVLRAAAGSRNV